MYVVFLHHFWVLVIYFSSTTSEQRRVDVSVLMSLACLLPLQRGDRLSTSESDVCRRQILTSKVDPRTERVKIFIMVLDPYNIGIEMKRKMLTDIFMMIS